MKKIVLNIEALLPQIRQHACDIIAKLGATQAKEWLKDNESEFIIENRPVYESLHPSVGEFIHQNADVNLTIAYDILDTAFFHIVSEELHDKTPNLVDYKLALSYANQVFDSLGLEQFDIDKHTSLINDFMAILNGNHGEETCEALLDNWLALQDKLPKDLECSYKYTIFKSNIALASDLTD